MLLTGCYGEEIAQLHNQIDAIEFRDIVAQVNEMKTTVTEIRELSDQLNGLITPLTTMKGELEAKIAANEGNISELQRQLTDVNNTLNDLLVISANISSLDSRIKELEDAKYGDQIEETKKNLEEALKQLEGLAGIKADIEKLQGETSEIPEIWTSIDNLKGQINQGIIDAISESKDEIFQWISENLDIQGALSNYYTKAEIDSKISSIDVTKDVTAIKTRLNGLADEIKNAVNAAIEGTLSDVQELKGKVTGFEEEITKIWKEFEKIGDLTKLSTEAKDNLVNAINELASMIQENGGKLEGIIDSVRVKALLSGLESMLTIAIQNGDLAVAANANGRIDSLCNVILGITTAETGLIDSRIDAAIDALGDLVTSDELAGFLTADDIIGLASKDDIEALRAIIGTADDKGTLVARIAALEAIYATIEGTKYTSWDKAVEAVYDSLKSKVGNISAIQTTLSSLSGTIQKIENLIGTGFNETNTIAKAISDLNTLTAGLASSSSLRSAIDSLAGIHNDLINALLGIGTSKIAGIDDTNNLKALKERIDNFLKGTTYTTLQEAIDAINKSIQGIQDQIGEGFNKGNTIAEAIEAIKKDLKDAQESLTSIEDKKYDQALEEISKRLEAIDDIISNYSFWDALEDLFKAGIIDWLRSTDIAQLIERVTAVEYSSVQFEFIPLYSDGKAHANADGSVQLRFNVFHPSTVTPTFSNTTIKGSIAQLIATKASNDPKQIDIARSNISYNATDKILTITFTKNDLQGYTDDVALAIKYGTTRNSVFTAYTSSRYIVTSLVPQE